MPRIYEGPRLYLDPKRWSWSIRDRDKFVRTGIPGDQIERAKQALTTYTNRKNRNRIMRTVYFVTCDAPDFPVKIGISADVQERLRDIRTSLPFEVLLLASFEGTTADEVAVHRRFETVRIKGEWFKRTNELMDYIGSVSVHTVCQQTETACELEEVTP